MHAEVLERNEQQRTATVRVEVPLRDMHAFRDSHDANEALVNYACTTLGVTNGIKRAQFKSYTELQREMVVRATIVLHLRDSEREQQGYYERIEKVRVTAEDAGHAKTRWNQTVQDWAKDKVTRDWCKEERDRIVAYHSFIETDREFPAELVITLVFTMHPDARRGDASYDETMRLIDAALAGIAEHRASTAMYEEYENKANADFDLDDLGIRP